MADRPPSRLAKALIDLNEQGISHFAQFTRAAEQATSAFENFYLAIPTDDVKRVRQVATDAIDRAMR